MVNAKCMLGYRRVSLAGTEIRGHEFHYSHLEGDTSNSEAAVTTAAGRAASTKIFIKRRTLASYFHFFWGENGVSIVKLVDEVSKQSRMQNG
jgi:cobyrinic acid a,c-diamide synthase